MFEYFSDSSRRLMWELKPQAALLRNDYFGTEHLLLSIAKINQPLTQLMGTSYTNIFDSIVEMIGYGQLPAGTSTWRPFTVELNNALDSSINVMRSYRHFPLDPLHIITALLENEYAPAHVYLSTADVDVDALLERLDYQLRLLPVWSSFSTPDQPAVPLFQQTYQAEEILQIVS